MHLVSKERKQVSIPKGGIIHFDEGETIRGRLIAGNGCIRKRRTKQRSGHVVSIGTMLVDQPLAGAHSALPVITKSTLPVFSRALAMEYLADGIRANTISAGVVDTPMHANDDHYVLRKLHPIPRLVQMSEAEYLCPKTNRDVVLLIARSERLPLPVNQEPRQPHG